MQPQMQAQVQMQGPDNEGGMARADLYRAAKHSMKLFQMIQDNQQLEGWVQAKITKAADYLDSIYHYMEYQVKFGQGAVAASVDDITGDMETAARAAEEDDEKDDMEESMNYEQHLKALLEGAVKKAKKDYDKDGKIESEKDEVIGSRRRAAGLDKKVKEAAEKCNHSAKGKKCAIHGLKECGSMSEADDGRKFDPLKHVKNPTKGEKTAAKDVKRGSYADRAAMLKSAEKDDRLKEAFPTVDSAKKSAAGTASMKTGEKKKTSSGGTVTKTATGSVHKAGAKGYGNKWDGDSQDQAPAKSKAGKSAAEKKADKSKDIKLPAWKGNVTKHSSNKGAEKDDGTGDVKEADDLRARGGIEAVNKKPRAGQTDYRNIPAGNYPGSQRKFSDKDREEQPGRLKAAIKSTLGKHTRPKLPESVKASQGQRIAEAAMWKRTGK